MVASGVSRIIILRRAFEKRRQIREFEPTHVGCYVLVAQETCAKLSNPLICVATA